MGPIDALASTSGWMVFIDVPASLSGPPGGVEYHALIAGSTVVQRRVALQIVLQLYSVGFVLCACCVVLKIGSHPALLGAVLWGAVCVCVHQNCHWGLCWVTWGHRWLPGVK